MPSNTGPIKPHHHYYSSFWTKAHLVEPLVSSWMKRRLSRLVSGLPGTSWTWYVCSKFWEVPGHNPDALGAQPAFATTKPLGFTLIWSPRTDCYLMFGRKRWDSPRKSGEEQEATVCVSHVGRYPFLNLFNSVPLLLYGVLKRHGLRDGAYAGKHFASAALEEYVRHLTPILSHLGWYWLRDCKTSVCGF